MPGLILVLCSVSTHFHQTWAGAQCLVALKIGDVPHRPE